MSEELFTREERFYHQVKLQATQVEQLLADHNLDGHVSTGQAVADEHNAKQIRFDVQGRLHAGWERVMALKGELQQALDALDVKIGAHDGGLRINIFQDDRPPVPLLDVLETVDDLPALTAVVGWAEDDRPVLLDLTNPESPHLTIIGETQAGKTALLQTIALSLALTNRASQLQMGVIGGDPQLRPLEFLPHLLAPVTFRPQDSIGLLNFLADEVVYRTQQQVTSPAILLLIDSADQLLKRIPSLLQPLTRLLVDGPKANIHLVLAMQDPVSDALDDLLFTYAPMRIVGRAGSLEEAERLSGIYDSRAEELQGKGDFLAVAGDMVVNFQGAFLTKYDLHLCLDHLQQQRAASLLARPLNVRKHFEPAASPTMVDISFERQPAEPHLTVAEAAGEATIDVSPDIDAVPLLNPPVEPAAKVAETALYEPEEEEEAVAEAPVSVVDAELSLLFGVPHSAHAPPEIAGAPLELDEEAPEGILPTSKPFFSLHAPAPLTLPPSAHSGASLACQPRPEQHNTSKQPKTEEADILPLEIVSEHLELIKEEAAKFEMGHPETARLPKPVGSRADQAEPELEPVVEEPIPNKARPLRAQQRSAPSLNGRSRLRKLTPPHEKLDTDEEPEAAVQPALPRNPQAEETEGNGQDVLPFDELFESLADAADGEQEADEEQELPFTLVYEDLDPEDGYYPDPDEEVYNDDWDAMAG